MSKIKRKYMAHYISTGFVDGVENHWYRLGKDLEEFNIEMNAVVTRESNIIGNDYVYIDGYELSGEVEEFYADVDDELFIALQKAIDIQATGKVNACRLCDVHLWDAVANATNTYTAVAHKCCVVPSNYGGDTTGYGITFSLQIYGEPIPGTFKVGGKNGGTFTANQG